jgi:hypothetical protein
LREGSLVEVKEGFWQKTEAERNPPKKQWHMATDASVFCTAVCFFGIKYYVSICSKIAIKHLLKLDFLN